MSTTAAPPRERVLVDTDIAGRRAMKQRLPGRAWFSGGSAHRPRVLVEDDDPALAISDFSAYRQANFDVGFCSGPGSTPEACPLLRGKDCELLAGADVVLHRLDRGLGIAAAIRRQRPDIPVLVEQRSPADAGMTAVPEGCLPLPYLSSVQGQVDALRRALAGRQH